MRKSKIKTIEYCKKWYLKNKKRLNRQHKEYNQKHKEKIALRKKKYYQLNKEKIILQQKKYYKINKDKKIQQQRIYIRHKLKTNTNFKIICYLRNRVKSALKRNAKRGHTLILLGCSIDLLRLYLQSKFQSGMSWSNYGKWHIDHIIPCARFNLSKVSEQKKCFNYINLQPLWAEENIRKSDNLTNTNVRKEQ